MNNLKSNAKDIQYKSPNIKTDSSFILYRCFCCNEDIGVDNWIVAAAKGYCAWCGWSEKEPYFHDYKEGADL